MTTSTLRGNTFECYLCGELFEKKKITRDHVIARCLFPEKNPPDNLLTLHCCKKCQKSYEKDEENFRNNISMISNPQNTAALEGQNKTTRSLRYSRRLHTDFSRRTSFVNMYTPSGLYLGPKPVISFSEERTNRVLKKISHGIFYNHMKKCMSGNFIFKAFLNPYIPSDLYNAFTKRYTCGCYYKDIFSCFGIIDSKTHESAWLMSFYKSVYMMVYYIIPEKTDDKVLDAHTALSNNETGYNTVTT